MNILPEKLDNVVELKLQKTTQQTTQPGELITPENHPVLDEPVVMNYVPAESRVEESLLIDEGIPPTDNIPSVEVVEEVKVASEFVIHPEQTAIPEPEAATPVTPDLEVEIQDVVQVEQDEAVNFAVNEAPEPISTINTEQFHEPAIEIIVNEAQKEAIISAVEVIATKQELEEPVKEKVETAIVALPESVQTAVAEYFKTSEPEQIEKVTAIITSIAVAADRLHNLVQQELTETEEAQQIEILLEEWCEELLAIIGIEDKEKILVLEFIKTVKSANYKSISLKVMAEEILDETNFELKQGLMSLAHDMPDMLRQRFGTMLGRLTLHQSFGVRNLTA